MSQDKTDVTRRQKYEQLRSALMTDRSSFDSHWRELGTYIEPRRTRFVATDVNRGDRRNGAIIDSSASFSLRTLQSGMHAGLTSPARPWFRLTTPDPAMAEGAATKAWLHTVTTRLLTIFGRSTLYNALPTFYGDLGTFGTAAMSVVDDTQDLLRCEVHPIGSYACGLDERGMVTTFAREYQLTVRQIVQEFVKVPGSKEEDWSKVSRQVREAWNRHAYQQAVPLVWLVMPNDEADPNKLGSRYLPFRSCHYELGRDERDGAGVLRESGFRQFPVMVARWSVTGEDIYGTNCPGMLALGDIKALQLMQKRKAQAVEKMINPPLQAPWELKSQKTSLLPGDVSFVDTSNPKGGIRPIHETRVPIGELTADIGETQRRIQRAFFEDLFLMMAQSDLGRGTQPITAREVQERHEEKLLALGPVLERTNKELLDPLIDRAFDLALRAGLLPEPPAELDGLDLKVEYVSMMAAAQKMIAVAGQERFLQTAVGVISIFPEARHKIDAFQLIDDAADALGINPKLIRSDDDAQQSLQAEQAAIAKAQQLEQLAIAAKSAQQLGATPMDQGDTALTRLVAAQGQQQGAA